MLKSDEGKKIICHFGLSIKNKKVSLLDLLLQWDHQSKKDQSQCPFKITFSHQGKKAYMKKEEAWHLSSANQDYQDLSYDQARALSSKKVIAVDEMTGLDDPFIWSWWSIHLVLMIHSSTMLHKIMQEDSDTWEALSIMNDLKALAPGFNVYLQKDSNGKLIGVMHMTAQIRYNAHQYGSVLCLNAQKFSTTVLVGSTS